MSWHIVINRENGEAFSIGTILADPMPAHLEAIALADEDADKLLSGQLRWDGASRSLVAVAQAEIQP